MPPSVKDFEQAVDALRDVLERDPGDPHFARYYLASCLLRMEPCHELDELLQRHDDHSGVWRFAQALQAFRRAGDSEESQRLLAEAHRLEPGFEEYLLGDNVVDAGLAVRFDAGIDQRAFSCARLFLPAWRGVPGAASWARRILKVPPGGNDSGAALRRFPRQELLMLPQRRETWQLGLMASQEVPEDDPSFLWLFCVANVEGREIRAMTVIDETLTEVVAWNRLIRSFQPVTSAAV